MYLSKLFIPITKDLPAEAKIKSHQLMLRAGMIKQSSTAGNWNIMDNTRQTFNDADGGPVLRADISNAEEETDTMQGQIDILSNGFKLRANNSSYNTNGATSVYLAFAEIPYKFSNAR